MKKEYDEKEIERKLSDLTLDSLEALQEKTSELPVVSHESIMIGIRHTLNSLDLVSLQRIFEELLLSMEEDTFSRRLFHAGGLDSLPMNVSAAI